jgi:Arc/MetJ-type ribon-helix-helix transcriptional regulator
MGKFETLTVDLPEDLAAALRASVERGEFASASASDAVTLALDSLLGDPADDPAQTERLRRLVEEGIASGVSELRTMDEILVDARRRHDLRRA